MKEKICNQCLRSLPDTHEHFYLRNRSDGSTATVSVCKNCQNQNKKDKRRKKPKTKKICPQCGLSFPATPYYFYTVTIKGVVYLRKYCKECAKVITQNRYYNNQNKILKQSSERYRNKCLQKSIGMLK